MRATLILLGLFSLNVALAQDDSAPGDPYEVGIASIHKRSHNFDTITAGDTVYFSFTEVV